MRQTGDKKGILSVIANLTHDHVHSILQEKPKLVGFTSSFEQICSSLALTKAMKEQAEKDIPIIFGGANCGGDMDSALLKCASEQARVMFTRNISRPHLCFLRIYIIIFCQINVK